MITLNDISILIVSSTTNLSMLRDVYHHTRNIYPCNEIVIVYDGIDVSQLINDDKLLIQIPTSRRVYVGEGYNLAVKNSSKSCFVFLHDDTFVAPNFLENIIPYISENVFCNFCQVEPISSNEVDTIKKPIIDFGGRNFPFDKDSFFKFYYERSAQLERKVEESIYGGFFMAGFKDSFLKIGGFDEDFKPYFFEDSDLMTRMHIAGYSFVLSLDSLVYHVGSVTSRIDSYQSHFSHLKTFNIFLKKWKTTFDLYKEYSMKNKIKYNRNKIKFKYKNCNQYLINLIKLIEDDDNFNILIELDGNNMTQTDTSHLLSLPFIINDTVEAGIYNVGNLKIEVKYE